MGRAGVMALGAGGLLALAWFAGPYTANDAPCQAGAWRQEGAGVVVLVPTAGNQPQLRWLLMDGSTGTLTPDALGRWRGNAGWTEQPHPTEWRFNGCDTGQADGHPVTKLALDMHETRFQSRGVELAGRLVLPPGVERVPVVVLVHGSETRSARDHSALQYLYPAHGIGVFVYDKRGTGASGGNYTQDFDLLADDAVASLAEARRLAGPRLGASGFEGASQGGWVAPLAATRTEVDFVLVAYGLAVSPWQEDQAQVDSELAAAGFGREERAHAREVARVTGRMMSTRMEQGAQELDGLRRRHARSAWWPRMKGEYTGDLVSYPTPLLRLALPWFDKGTPWDHDPMPVLRMVDAPMLWILAEDDRDAPPAETLRRLDGLAKEQRPITYRVFPDTDHGIVEFTTGEDERRMKTRYATGYLSMKVEWIRSAGRGQTDPPIGMPQSSPDEAAPQL